jgi:hypothetical protein
VLPGPSRKGPGLIKNILFEYYAISAGAFPISTSLGKIGGPDGKNRQKCLPSVSL